jgi:hypothetical protein
MIMYHVTLKCHVPGIAREGVRPDLARGKIKASWWCKAERISWSIAHVCNRHGVVPARVVVLSADIDASMLRCTRFAGVFFIRELVDLKDSIAPISAAEYLGVDENQCLDGVYVE